MIMLSVALLLLAVFGAPLFAVIASSAMLGYRGEEIDLMAIAIEIGGKPRTFQTAVESARLLRVVQ